MWFSVNTEEQFDSCTGPMNPNNDNNSPNNFGLLASSSPESTSIPAGTKLLV